MPDHPRWPTVAYTLSGWLMLVGGLATVGGCWAHGQAKSPGDIQDTRAACICGIITDCTGIAGRQMFRPREP